MKSRGNALQDAIHAAANLRVREAQDAQPQTFQELLPDGVLLARILVHRSVYLDDQAGLGAVEVNKEAIDGVLAKRLAPCGDHRHSSHRQINTSFSGKIYGSSRCVLS